jgi:hypothetical protein
MLLALIEKGIWTSSEAVAYILRLPHGIDRYSAIAAIDPCLLSWQKESLQQHALQEIRQLTSEFDQHGALCALSPCLTSGREIAQALSIIRNLTNRQYKTSALQALVPLVPDSLAKDAWSLANELGDTDAMLGLAQYLPERLLNGLLETILSAQTSEDYRVSLLVRLLPFLPPLLHDDAIRQETNKLTEIKNAYGRGAALAGIAPYLSRGILELELDAIIGILENAEQDSAAVIPYLMPYLPDHLIEAAFRIAQRVTKDEERAKLMATLGPRLSPSLQQEALETIRTVSDPGLKSVNLAKLSKWLEEPVRRSVLEEAFWAACTACPQRHFVDPMEWNHLSKIAVLRFADIAPSLPKDLRDGAFRRALRIAQEVIPASAQDYLRLQVAGAMVQAGDLEDALSLAQSFPTNRLRVDLLKDIVPLLPTTDRYAMLRMLRTIRDASYRRETLWKIAPHLTGDELEEALQVAKEINDEACIGAARAMLFEFVPAIKQQQAVQLEVKAVEEVEGDQAEFAHVNDSNVLDYQEQEAIANLSLLLPESGRLDIALSSLVNLDKEHVISEIFLALATKMAKQGRAKHALKQAREIDLKFHLSARNTTQPSWFGQLVMRLAPYLTEEDWPEVMTITRELTEQGQAEILWFLAPFYRGRFIGEALNLAHGLRDKQHRAVAFMGLLQHLPSEIREGLAAEAASLTRQLAGDKSSPENTQPLFTLVTLSRFLPSALAESLIDYALSVAQNTADKDNRVLMLGTLLPFVSESIYPALRKQIADTVGTVNWDASNSRLFSSNATLVVEMICTALELGSLAVAMDLLDLLRDAWHCCQYDTIRGPLGRDAVTEALSQVVPYLEGSLKTEFAQEGLDLCRRSHNHDEAQFRRLSRLLPHLPLPLRDQVLWEVVNNEWGGYIKSNIASLVPDLPDVVLDHALPFLLLNGIANRGRWQLLADLRCHLVGWVRRRPLDAYFHWRQYIQTLSRLRRPDFLTEFVAVIPFTLELAGKDQEEVAMSIFRSVNDVSRWWP